jgi:cell division protein FtsL
MLLSGLVLAQWAPVALFIIIALCAASVVVYSYVEWKREQHPASTPR